MEKKRNNYNTMIIRQGLSLLVLITVLVATSQVMAQTGSGQFIQEPQVHNAMNQAGLLDFTQYNTVEHSFAWNEVPYQSDFYNFLPDQPYVYAGDVNGSGRINLVQTFLANDVDNPGDRLFKSFLYEQDFSLDSHLQYIEYRVIPAGDLTGNGHADAFGISFNSETVMLLEGSVSAYQEMGNLSFTTNINHTNGIGFSDLNGNGHDDYAWFSGNMLNVIFGSDNPDDILFSEYDISLSEAVQDLGGISVRSYNTIVIDGRTILFAGYYAFSENFSGILVLEFDADRNIAITNSAHHNDRFMGNHLYVNDYNGNGSPEVLYTADWNTYVASILNIETMEISESAEILLEGERAYPLGNLTGNGLIDFCYSDVDGSKIGEGQADFSGSFNNTHDLVYNDENLNCRHNKHGGFGDVYGNGKNTLLAYYESENQFGHVTVQMEGSVLTINPYFYDWEDYAADAIIATVNLGDINGNGFDDLALVREVAGTNSSEIDIYYGGKPFAQNPDVVIQGPENSFANKLLTVDFTGDGNREIFIPWGLEYDGGNGYEVRFSFYEANNPGGAPVYQFGLDDISDFTGIQFQESINIDSNGDVTGNGKEDILIGFPRVFAPDGNNLAVLLEGSESYNLNTYRFEGGGAMVNVLGDINGNGYPDLLINTPITNNLQAYLFYGREQYEDELYTPDDTLRLAEHLTDTGQNRFSFLGVGGAVVGDFNNDGYQDIVMSTFGHEVSDTDLFSGTTALFIFNGAKFFNDKDHTTTSQGMRLLEDAYRPEDRRTESAYLTLSLGTLAAIPDMTGNGADELLYASSPPYTSIEVNAGIYEGKFEFEEFDEPSRLLLSPNPQVGIGPNSNNVAGHGVIAVGRFQQANQMDIVLPHIGDFRYRGSGAYAFSLPYEGNPVSVDHSTTPGSFALSQNYPNPFNPSTVISYQLPVSSEVRLEVFDLLGRRVATLVDGTMETGQHTTNFEASRLAGGMYIYRLKAGDFVQTRKMMLIK